MSYKVGSKCSTNASISSVDACADSDIGAATIMGSADNRPGGVDCGDNGGENATEESDGSGGDDGDAGVDMATGDDSELDKSGLFSTSFDTQSSLTYIWDYTSIILCQYT